MVTASGGAEWRRFTGGGWSWGLFDGREEGSLFAYLGKHEIFAPTKAYPPMSVGELAGI